MLAEAMKTPEIEGEYFSREDVMSSLKVHFWLVILAGDPVDAAGNPKHAISLLTNYGTERVTLRNPYRILPITTTIERKEK